MENQLPAIIFGAFLIAAGAAMLVYQLRNRETRAEDFKLDPHDRRYFEVRNRRRIQVAGLILIIGVMIPVGDSLIPWQRAATTFAIYWMLVLALSFWTILLAFGDMLATRMHTRVSIDRLRAQQRDLEAAAAQLRRKSDAESGPPKGQVFE